MSTGKVLSLKADKRSLCAFFIAKTFRYSGVCKYSLMSRSLIFKRFCKAMRLIREAVYRGEVSVSTRDTLLSAAFLNAFSKPSVQSNVLRISSGLLVKMAYFCNISISLALCFLVVSYNFHLFSISLCLYTACVEKNIQKKLCKRFFFFKFAF